MDRIDKLLLKLSSKQRAALIEIIKLIQAGNFQGLDLLKLKGRSDTYRVRKGAYRIIFLMKSSDDVRIISIEKRSDTTYSF